jgi:hypothetical protein
MAKIRDRRLRGRVGPMSAGRFDELVHALTWVAVGPALLSLRPPRPRQGQWLIRPG